MTTKWLKPTLYKDRGLELQLLNAACNAHDLACGCTKPLLHFRDILKCHLSEETTTGEDGAKDVVPEDGFDTGDLEQLFGDDPFNTEEENG